MFRKDLQMVPNYCLYVFPIRNHTLRQNDFPNRSDFSRYLCYWTTLIYRFKSNNFSSRYHLMYLLRFQQKQIAYDSFNQQKKMKRPETFITCFELHNWSQIMKIALQKLFIQFVTLVCTDSKKSKRPTTSVWWLELCRHWNWHHLFYDKKSIVNYSSWRYNIRWQNDSTHTNTSFYWLLNVNNVRIYAKV